MVKLTERLVLARSRALDIENVRKLNCWASDLTDISIIRKMSNVQIVSLSVNHIASLEDFAGSLSLEELYIRKNNIANLAEIHYLCRLPRLRVLWLADNPCAVGDRYRMTVLKTLPNLQRLDNIPVQEEEVNEAIEQGLDITQLTATLKSLKSSPQSSPVQCRKSKKTKEKKESKNTEDKAIAKEKATEKVLLLEDDGKVRNDVNESKESQVEERVVEEREMEKTDFTEEQPHGTKSLELRDAVQECDDDIRKESPEVEGVLDSTLSARASSPVTQTAEVTEPQASESVAVIERREESVGETVTRDGVESVGETGTRDGRESVEGTGARDGVESLRGTGPRDGVESLRGTGPRDGVESVEGTGPRDRGETGSRDGVESVRGTGTRDVGESVEGTQESVKQKGDERIDQDEESVDNAEEEAIEHTKEEVAEQTDTPSVSEDYESEIDEELEEGEVTIPSARETNEIRIELGLKPLSPEKLCQPTHSRPSHATKIRNANILQAVLHLLRELDEDSLQVVADVIHSKLESL